MKSNKKPVYNTIKREVGVENTKFFDWDNIILSLGVMTDTHIGDPNTKESMRQGIRYMTKLFDGYPDAFLHAGDLSNSSGHGNDAQIEVFKEVYLEEAGIEVPFIYCLGPTHDQSKDAEQPFFRTKFENILGADFFKYQVSFKGGIGWSVRHSALKGFDFFSIDWSGGSQGIEYTEEDKKWLQGEIEACIALNPERHIFVLLHGPWIQEIIDTLSGYRQVICFTGHSHNSISREDSILQDKGYTRMHCGGMDYYRVDGYNRFYSDPFLNLGDKRSIAQAVVALVDKNETVLLVRIECIREKVIFPCYEICKDNFGAYTVERFKNGGFCTFGPDSKLKITKCGENAMEISFSPCKSGVAGPPLYYTVKVLCPDDNNEYSECAVLDIASQEVYYPNGEGMPEYITSCVAENVNLKDFAVLVTAKDCRSWSENALMFTNGSFKYSGEAVGTAIIDL